MKRVSLIMLLFGAMTFGMTSCSGNSKQEETEHHEGDHNHEHGDEHHHDDEKGHVGHNH